MEHASACPYQNDPLQAFEYNFGGDLDELGIEYNLSHAAKERFRIAADPLGACSNWWARAEARWRDRWLRDEEARLLHHLRVWHEFLPESRLNVSNVVDSKSNYGSTSPLDYWEADWPCVADERVPPFSAAAPSAIGDGPKWMCGPRAIPKPCRVVSLGSNADDLFERGLHALQGCVTLIVDPTMGAKAPAFAARVADIGATLNATVGIGQSGHMGTSRMGHRGRFPLVSLSELLRDQYGVPPHHVAVLKVDIEGHEWATLLDVWRECEAGRLTIDHLLIEVHVRRAAVAQLYALFSGAQRCGLALTHKERNSWGCWKGHCVEYAWVSLRHAHRLAREDGLRAEWATPTVPET